MKTTTIQPYDVIHLVFVFGATLIMTSLFAMIGVDSLHDGVLLKPAIDVAQGMVLFRDTATYYGPLTTLLQAWAINLFGEHLIVIRLLTAFFYAATSVFLWLVWSRFLPKWLATLSCMLWLFLAPYYLLRWTFLPWSSVYALFFQIVASYFVVLFLERKILTYLFFAGASSALTFWCRQPVGILLLVSLIGFLFAYNLITKSKLLIKTVVYLISGFFSISLVFLIWIIANYALEDYYLQQFKFIYLNFFKNQLPGSTIDSIRTIFNFLFSGLEPIWNLLPFVSLLLLLKAFTDFIYRKTFTTKQLTVVALVFVSIASWAQYFPVNCHRHVYWAATPMVGLFSYFIWNFMRNEIKATRVVMTLVLLYFAFRGEIGGRIEQGMKKLNQTYVQVNVPLLCGMKLSPSESLNYQKIENTILAFEKIHPTHGVINIGVEPLHSLFASHQEKMSPPFYADYSDKLREYIQNQRPLVIDGGNGTPVNFFDTTVDGFEVTQFLNTRNSAKRVLYCPLTETCQ